MGFLSSLFLSSLLPRTWTRSVGTRNLGATRRNRSSQGRVHAPGRMTKDVFRSSRSLLPLFLSPLLESLTENLECGEWRERASRVCFAHEKARAKVETDVSQIFARPIYSINHLRSVLIVSQHLSS